jgi:hypothetical protein
MVSSYALHRIWLQPCRLQSLDFLRLRLDGAATRRQSKSGKLSTVLKVKLRQSCLCSAQAVYGNSHSRNGLKHIRFVAGNDANTGKPN